MTPTFTTRRTRLPVLVLTPAMRVADPLPVLIARRAQRVNNRDRAAAENYERRHLALRAQLAATT